MPGTSWPAPVLDCGQHGRGRRRACHNRAVTALDPAGDPGAAGRRAGRARPRWCPGRRPGPRQFTTYAGHSGLTATLTVAAGLGAGRGRPGHFGRQADGSATWPCSPVWSGSHRCGWAGTGTAAGPQPGHARRRAHLPAAAPPGARLPKRPTAGRRLPGRCGCRLPGGRGRRPRPSAVPGSLLRPQLLGQLQRQPVPAALAPGPCPCDRGAG